MSTVDAVVAPVALLLALRWADEYDSEQAAIASFNGEDARAILPPELRWSAWRESPRPLTAEEVGSLWDGIRGVLGLPADPRRSYREVRLPSGQLLSVMVRWLEQFPVDTPASRRQAGEGFTELVLQAMDVAQFGGELITPRAMSRMMVALANPQPGERIYDPCFGAGSLLVEAAEALWQQGRYVAPGEWSRALRVPVFGVERHAELQLVAFVRLLLAGVRPALELGDALEREAAGRHHDQGFDCVLVDPPWGGRVGGAELHDFPIRGRLTENLFLQHAVRSLRPGGRAVISVPPSLLMRDGPDSDLREWLIEECHVELVLRLPAKSLRYTAIAPNLLVIRRAPPADVVRFAELTGLPEGVRASRALAQALLAGEDVAPHTVQSVSITDLRKTAYRLTPPATLNPEVQELIEACQKHTEFARLGDVADLIPGRHIPAVDLSDEPGSGLVPLIRGADLREPTLVKPSKYVSPGAMERLPDRNLIYEGDLMVATVGSIGSSLLLSESPQGAPVERDRSRAVAVAHQSIVIVRTHETLDARFLQAVLKSDALQALLRAQASELGSAYRITTSQLRELPVPVPPPSVQELVLRRLTNRPGDAMDALLGVLSGREEDPLSRVFQDNVAIGRLVADGTPEPEELRQLGLAAFMMLRHLRNHVAHEMADIDPHAQRWLLTIGSAPVATRRRKGEDPDYELLESTRTILESALETARRIGGLIGRHATRLTERLQMWLDDALHRAAGDFRLEVQHALESSSEHNAGTLVVTARLVGSVPLLDFTAHLDVGDEEVQVPELAPGDVASMRVPLTSERLWEREPDGTRVLRCLLLWSARRVDEQFVKDAAPIVVQWRVAEPEATAGPQDLGVSPYITGDVVESPRMFVGRKAILEDLRTHLGGGTRVVLLEGNRRTGKTSILRQLQRPEQGLNESWVLVECSFQGTVGDPSRDGISTEGIFRLMVRDIGLACAKAGFPVPLPDMDAPQDLNAFRFRFAHALNDFFRDIDPYEALQIYVDMVTEAIAPRRLLLMLDEFDKVQVGIDNGVTSPQVPENIRNLLQTRPAVSTILTGSRRLKRLREEYWSALFGFGHRIGVDPLDPAEVRELVTRPVAGRLTFEETAVTLIASITARQPYLVQSLCARVFELAKRSGWRHIRRAEVAEAVTRMVRDNEHFHALWGYAETERRRYLLCLCHRLAKGDERVNAALLNEHLGEAGIVVPIEDVDNDLKFLVELELVAMDNTQLGPQYTLAVPLMGLWMEGNVDAEAVRRKAVYEQQLATGRGDGWGYGDGEGGGRGDGSGHGYGQVNGTDFQDNPGELFGPSAPGRKRRR